ncbi:MAG: hypothetical protein QI223_08615 [Candidatus Korarchaeota archaeon]|nr:hypothetical protein [Candidatus Korarchaeota archaeon]
MSGTACGMGRRWFAAEIPRVLEEEREFYSLPEYAIAGASRAPDSLLRPRIAHSRDEPCHPVPPFGRRHGFSDPREASAWVRRDTKTPTLGAEAATGLGYSKLVPLLSCVGEFIRSRLRGHRVEE